MNRTSGARRGPSTGRRSFSRRGNARPAAESISREVLALGREVSDALLAIVENKELRAVGSEMTSSVQRVGDKMVHAARRMGASTAPGRITRQMGRVLGTGARRGVSASGRMRGNLASGLRKVGQQLTRLGQRLED